MSIDELLDRTKKATVSTIQPYLDLAKTGQKPAGQFRVKWLRRALIILWSLAATLTGISLIVSFAGLFAAYTYLSRGQSLVDSFASTNLIFDLWVATSLGLLAHAWKLRAQGSKEKIKIWKLVTAIAIVCGRSDSFLVQLILSAAPNRWLYFWPIKFVIVPPIVLIVGGAINLFSLYFAVTAFVLTIVVIPLKIYQALFNISNSLFITKARSTAFFGTLVSFWFWFTGSALPTGEEVPDDTKGARFATPKEIEALRAADGMAFGHVNGAPLLLQNEKHVLIMASTRSGKGTSLIVPHLLRYPGSAFVLDPKGENAKATGRRRASLNEKVLYLDPFGLSGRPKARFNPLKRFTPENMEAESKALAAALILSPERSHWTASAQQLLAAFILHVFTSPDYPDEEKDLNTVRRLILSEAPDTLKAMVDNHAADGLLRMLSISFSQTPEKEFGSILSSAQRETEILDNPFIAACLSATGEGEEVNFADWHEGTMTVYLCLSAPKFPVFNRWLRLVLTAALDEMTDGMNPPPVPVCFMLDELATLGHLQAVENAVGLAAGYGIQLVTVFQDVAQMKDLYKGRWASFIGNAGVRALFNLDDFDTAQYWSRFIGGRLVETTSVSQSNEGLAKGQTKGETIRPLKSPEELMLEFDQKQMLILPQGSHPITTERVAYFDDDELKGLWDDPRTDKEKKAAPPADRVTTPSPPVQKQEPVRNDPPAPVFETRPAPPVQAKAEEPKVAPAPMPTPPAQPKAETPVKPVAAPLKRTARERTRRQLRNATRRLAERKQEEPSATPPKPTREEQARKDAERRAIADFPDFEALLVQITEKGGKIEESEDSGCVLSFDGGEKRAFKTRDELLATFRKIREQLILKNAEGSK